MAVRNQNSKDFNNWVHHVNGERQKECAIAFINLLRDNGVYDYVVGVFDEAHVDPDGLGYGGLRGYLRFTEPKDYVKNMHSNPPPEFAEFDVYWQELLTYIA